MGARSCGVLRSGAHVVIADLDISIASTLRGSRRDRGRLDVGDTSLVQATMAEQGPFDIVVNNAGATSLRSSPTPRRKIGQNCSRSSGLGFCMHPRRASCDAGSQFRSHHQHHLGSRALGSKGGGDYSAAKGGVIAFTRALRAKMPFRDYRQFRRAGAYPNTDAGSGRRAMWRQDSARD